MKRFRGNQLLETEPTKRFNGHVTIIERFLTNVDVMIRIFKLLELKDQLKLCLTSDQFRTVFECYIWKTNYRTLSILGFALKTIVTNDTEMDQLCLYEEEYRYFLLLYGEKVRTLQASFDAQPDITKFRNLTKLQYKYTKSIGKEHLQLVAETCLHLQELRLEYCGKCFANHIEITKILDVDVLVQMKNLQRLCVIDRYATDIKYSHFIDIITKIKLIYLEISGCIVPDETTTAGQEIQLRELAIEAPFGAHKWSSNYDSFLRNFENLSILRLTANDVISEDVLEALTQICQQLETFHISSSVFDNILLFNVPPQVTDMSLNDCQGLTHDNLRQLLTMYKIKKFSSVDTQFSGVFDTFQISPSIESLDLDGLYTHRFQSVYTNNSNLKQLTWYGVTDGINGNSVVRRMPLETCLNLESLTLKSGFLSLAPLMLMKSLQKLAIPHSMPFLNWHYIIILLKHSTLMELDLGDGSPPAWLTKSMHIPDSGFPTTIKRLTLSLRLFFTGLSFWLDLFRCNGRMILTCQKFQMDVKIFRHIVTHERFPRSLKIIDMSGFTIYCNDLKRDFDNTMEKFLRDSYHIKILYRNKFCMTLQRNRGILI